MKRSLFSWISIHAFSRNSTRFYGDNSIILQISFSSIDGKISASIEALSNISSTAFIDLFVIAYVKGEN